MAGLPTARAAVEMPGTDHVDGIGLGLGLMGTLLFAIVNHSTNHVGNVLPAYNDGDTRCPNVCPCPIARALFVPSCVLRFTL